jgi:signal transduction histidine kinase
MIDMVVEQRSVRAVTTSPLIGDIITVPAEQGAVSGTEAEHRVAAPDVVAALVHELRTPLASLHAVVEVLVDTSADRPGEDGAWIQHLRRNVLWLQDMLENASTWALLETGRLACVSRPVSLVEVVDRAIGLIQPLLDKKGQRVKANLPAHSVPTVLGDVKHLIQVLVNLLTNAGVYSPRGDEIILDHWIEDGYVEVRVTDHGPGLSLLEQQQVFDRYRRGAAGQVVPGGMGLGLYIVKALVEAYGGKVGVDSTPGAGATFWFRLPSAGAAQSSAEPLNPVNPVRPNNLTF